VNLRKGGSHNIILLIDKIPWWGFVSLWLVLTLGFASLYYVLPVGDCPTIKTLGYQKFFDALYFSIVTETTLGYGDILPMGWSKFFVCIQVMGGLFLAGVIITRITSSHGRELRRIDRKASGYWIEPFIHPDEEFMISFSHIYRDGGTLRYDGDNYYESGTFDGYFRSKLIIYDKEVLKFEYSNNETERSKYVEGILILTFEKTFKNQWIQHSACCHDFRKVHYTKYPGYRATEGEFQIMANDNLEAKVELISKYRAKFDEWRSHQPARA